MSNNRGITLVFVALGLFVLMLFLGLATDTGVLVYVRSQGQARVDAAALAAAAGLIQPTAATRQTSATTLANTFSAVNSVVDSGTNPPNILTPMSFNVITGGIINAAGWSPGTTGENCNAVNISTTIPTPVFFAGIRAMFGGSSEPSVDIQVGATAHLPCPGLVRTDTAQGLAPIALRACKWTFPQSCDSPHRLYQQSQQDDNSLWTTYNANRNACSTIASGNTSGLDPVVKVGDTINTSNGQIEPCLRALRTHYAGCSAAQCSQEPADPACTAIVPVVECGGSQSNAIVVGFASVCFTGFDSGNAPKWVDGSLECGEVAPGSAGTGGCFGTMASNPILVR